MRKETATITVIIERLVALDPGALDIQHTARLSVTSAYPEWCEMASEVTWSSMRVLITDPEAVRTLREANIDI